MCSLNGVNAHMYSVQYNAAKEALRTLTRTAAREWAPRQVNCNVICPGAQSAAYKRVAEANPENVAVMAAQNPMGRIGDPSTTSAPLPLSWQVTTVATSREIPSSSTVVGTSTVCSGHLPWTDFTGLTALRIHTWLDADSASSHYAFVGLARCLSRGPTHIMSLTAPPGSPIVIKRTIANLSIAS